MTPSGRCELGTFNDGTVGVWVRCRREATDSLLLPIEVVQGSNPSVMVNACEEHVSQITGWH